MEQKKVGIIGGLGPLATIEFMRSVVNKTRVATEHDHLHLIVDCNPKVPDINAAVLGIGPTSAPALQENAQRLERAGADFLVMICNAAHVFEAEIRQAVSIPFISMIKEVGSAIRNDFNEVVTVGVLATDGCLKTGIYQTEIRARGLRSVVLQDTQLQSFMQAILRVKSGDLSHETQHRLLESIKQLVELGAQAVILGCTEIGLVARPEDSDVPLIDPCSVLADATVRLALKID